MMPVEASRMARIPPDVWQMDRSFMDFVGFDNDWKISSTEAIIQRAVFLPEPGR